MIIRLLLDKLARQKKGNSGQVFAVDLSSGRKVKPLTVAKIQSKLEVNEPVLFKGILKRFGVASRWSLDYLNKNLVSSQFFLSQNCHLIFSVAGIVDCRFPVQEPTKRLG